MINAAVHSGFSQLDKMPIGRQAVGKCRGRVVVAMKLPFIDLISNLLEKLLCYFCPYHLARKDQPCS